MRVFFVKIFMRLVSRLFASRSRFLFFVSPPLSPPPPALHRFTRNGRLFLSAAAFLRSTKYNIYSFGFKRKRTSVKFSAQNDLIAPSPPPPGKIIRFFHIIFALGYLGSVLDLIPFGFKLIF